MTRNGWHAVEVISHVSVIPDYEDGHVISAHGCWCGPTFITTDSETGEPYRVPLVSHRDLAQRNGSTFALTDLADPEG